MNISEIAAKIGARVIGADVEVHDVSSLKSATSTDLVFVDDPKHLAAALQSKAGAVVAGEFGVTATAKPRLIASQPRLAFAKAAELLHPTISRPAKVGDPQSLIHPTAVIDEGAHTAPSARIGPHAVIERGSRIGERTAIGAGVFIAQDVVIGDECDIRANVSIYAQTTLGNRVVVHSGAVLGSDGFGFVRDRETGRYTKFPQIGSLVIGDDVEIGANTTIDRGALDTTVISRGVKLDNMVHIGHNCKIGENVVIAAQTGISGSVVVEDGAIIGGQVGIGDHARIEKGVILGSASGVLTGKTISGEGVVFWGTPAKPLKQYLKELAMVARLAKKQREDR